MENPPFRILLIEDDPDDSMMLQTHLRQAGAQAELVQVTCLTDAANAIENNEFELVLLDLNLPDSRGLDTLAQILILAPHAPVIVMSGVDHESLALQAVQQGAQDFLVKGKIKAHELARAMLFSLERNRRQTQLQKLSLQDPLTNLYNRRGFMLQGNNTLHLARRTGQALILFLADLDNLKQINDTYGHLAGDQALISAADLFRKTFRKSEIVARLGGDEFAILIQSPAQYFSMLMTRLEQNLQEFNARPNHTFILAWCIGHTDYLPNSHDTLESLLSAADRVLYAEKEKRKAV